MIIREAHNVPKSPKNLLYVIRALIEQYQDQYEHANHANGNGDGKRLSAILTPTELWRARLISEGYSNKRIAELTHTTDDYTNQSIYRIYDKLGLGRVRDESSSAMRITLAIRYDREFSQRRRQQQVKHRTKR